MPNRVLYSGLLTSEKVNQLKPAEFELYIRLLLVADDFGRYSGSSVRIARTCWPDREDINSKQIEPILMKLHDVGLVSLYQVKNERYLEITNWNQRTRQMKSKYPSPDGQMTVNCQSDDSHMRTETETETETETRTYIYCSEQQVAAEPPADDETDDQEPSEDLVEEKPVIEIPLIDGTSHAVSQNQVNSWAELYQAVDVMAELRKMVGWCEANPKRRKTRKGIMRFATSWLARAQDSGRSSIPLTRHARDPTGSQDNYGWGYSEDDPRYPDFMRGGDEA